MQTGELCTYVLYVRNAYPENPQRAGEFYAHYIHTLSYILLYIPTGTYSVGAAVKREGPLERVPVRRLH